MDDAGSNPVAGTNDAREAYNAYMRDYLRRRYDERREWVIERLGGICAKCGGADDLEIDHVDRLGKLFEVSRMAYKRRLDDEELLVEIAKCQLLCRVCYKEKSDSETSVGHGGGLSGKRNCKCDPCKAKKSEYMSSRTYNQNRCRRKNCGCEKKHYAS